ncbi:MAG TPA: LacI family DNA-binding transcriptional regulator [Kineosporiaceae bacterium]|nr:LacI family DNA-binding transcriptional regulator [Kineosporiaceae bacterium]
MASAAGVSLKTVSRVINNEAGVSDDLVRRVEHAVLELDYRHNLAASNLRRGQRTASIGVLLHDLGNSFSGTLLRAIEDQARSRRIAVFSASLDDEPEREAILATDLISRRIDGLVLMPTGNDQSYLLADIRAGLAVFAVDRPANGVEIGTVVVDNAGGAREATAHLAARGHHRIACLTDSDSIWTAAQRRQGYLDGLTEYSLPLVPEFAVSGLTTADQATSAVLTMMRDPAPPTAIFAGRNDLTIGAVRALREVGKQDRIAVVGFDDFPTSDLLTPAITVVRQDVHATGAYVANLLFARMEGAVTAPERVVLPTTLVPRGSGELLPT